VQFFGVSLIVGNSCGMSGIIVGIIIGDLIGVLFVVLLT
jgi:hypothetical protein